MSVDVRSHILRSIDEIPLDKRKNICTSVDYSITRHDGYWEKLVNELGFSENDSKNFQLAFAKNQSPTENLLRECSYRNYRICTLYHVMKKIGLVKLAEENLDNFDSNPVSPFHPYMHMMSPHPMGVGMTEKPRRPTESSSNSSTHSGSESEKIGGLDTFHFSYDDIQRGTDNFAAEMKLGAGAFGKVYKVRLKNTTFACKVLTIDSDSPLNFSIASKHREHSDLKNELRFLAEYRHPNIIPLYGWSLDGKDPCLIYQYMKNGSLQDCLQGLKGNISLKWLTRAKVACDAARGLQFLHEAKEKPLIHGDIKTANILLDESFVAKLGDFGLAREGPRSSVTGSYIKLGNEHTPGTIGYLAKEYMDSKKLSVQVDTYAFGVVLLELYTGRRAFDRSERKATLLRDYMDDVACGMGEGGEENADNLLFEHQDAEIERMPEKTALEFVKLALECCSIKRNKRPSMLSTLRRLEKIRDAVKGTPEVVRGTPDEAAAREAAENKLEMKSTQTNLGRHNWMSAYKKNTDTHNLSKNPIEVDDNSLVMSGLHDSDSSLTHGEKNIYLPSNGLTMNEDFQRMNLNSKMQELRGRESQMPPPSFQRQENIRQNHGHEGQQNQHFGHIASSNPFHPHHLRGMHPSSVQLQTQGMAYPYALHPSFVSHMSESTHASHMSPIFSMWPQNLPMIPPYAPNFAPGMTVNQDPYYHQGFRETPVQKHPSSNESYDMSPKLGQTATTPVSPGTPWIPVSIPEAFSSLDLEPLTYALSSSGAGSTQGQEGDRNMVPTTTMSYNLQIPNTLEPYPPHNLHSGTVNGLGPRVAESQNRHDAAKLMPPKPHAVTVNDVKAEMLDLMEGGCDSYSQIFRSSPK